MLRRHLIQHFLDFRIRRKDWKFDIRTYTPDVYLRLAEVNVRSATNKLGYELPKFDLAQVYELKQKVNE